MNIKLEQPFRLFTESECLDIISRARQLNPSMARVMGYDPNRQHRNNSAFWLTLAESEYDYLWDVVGELQSEFALTWMQKPIQISRYQVGEYYDWHCDTYPSDGRTSVRSLTLTCTLQTAASAVFETRDDSWDLEPGWAVVFDSNREHRAQAPTQGERISLTVWYMKPNSNL
jgi:predicted 2-oxoglutarate/Fe(II)-dependent dioxygenase YbiX